MLRRLATPAAGSLAQRQLRHGKAGWALLFNLLWSLWAFTDPLFSPTLHPLWWPVTLASYVLFLLLYARVYLRPLRELPWYAAAMAMLGLSVMPFNHAGGTSYIIFSCAFLAFIGTLRGAFIGIGLVLLAFVAAAMALHWPWLVIAMMGAIAFSVGAGNVAYYVTGEKDAELRLSHEEVRKLAATAERERIGRDLHDLLGHTLSLITLKLELSRKLLDRDPDAARREMADAETVARHALAEVRSAVTGIRSADLAAELASARLLLESSGVDVEYDQPPPLPDDIERGLALVLREAATNIARHAHASRVRIGFARDHGRLRMQVADDGRGGIAADGNGLAGMRERVRALGGNLAIDSTRAGTTLQVELPLPAAAPAMGEDEVEAEAPELHP